MKHATKVDCLLKLTGATTRLSVISNLLPKISADASRLAGYDVQEALRAVSSVAWELRTEVEKRKGP